MLDSGLRCILLDSCVSDTPVWINTAAEKAGPQLLCDFLIPSVWTFLTCIIEVLRKCTNGVGVALLQDGQVYRQWRELSLKLLIFVNYPVGALSYDSKQEVFVVAVTGLSLFLHFNWQTLEVIIRNSGQIWKWVACRLSDHCHLAYLPTSFFPQTWMDERNGWSRSGPKGGLSALAGPCALEFSVTLDRGLYFFEFPCLDL